MSLRKFMHKNNKYKDEPNFKQLAILYSEFRKIAITDVAGKVRINFKDEDSLRILTKTLLKHDFNLEVEIPPKKLVPALPLRLNYILWIEDLLKHAGIKDLTLVHGIDIGTGAICIYPLLFSKMYQSKMTGTDIDSESISSAMKNIVENNLQNLINVILVNKESVLKEALAMNNDNYSFVMCNPPFFETDKGLGKKSKLEPPRNAPTGNEGELKINGGERDFIVRLIDESLEYKDRIKIYTTMFGQKSSLAFLRSELKKKGIVNTTWTEFCQGFTKRWGIAWTFATKDEIDLGTAPVIRTRAEILKLKKEKSMEIIFPAKDNISCLSELVTALKKWITELDIEMKEIELDDCCPYWACHLNAYNDNWSHARRKRRMAMRLENLKKKCIGNAESMNETEDLKNEQSISTETECGSSNNVENKEPLLVCSLLAGEKGGYNDEDDDSSSEEQDVNEPKMLRICMMFESGHGGKLSLETLRQYLVNKLDIRQYFHKQSPTKLNKKKRRKKKLNQSNIVEICQSSEL